MLFAVSRLHLLLKIFFKSKLRGTLNYEKPMPPKLFVFIPILLANDLDYSKVDRSNYFLILPQNKDR